MNKKQREAKRKNAQAHQKKVKDLAVQRIETRKDRKDRKQLITRELFKADRVIVEIPKAPVSDVFEEFFAKHLEQGSGVPMTSELVSLMRMTSPFQIIGRKCN